MSTGQAIGSALIDLEFHQLICERLEAIREHLQEEPIRVADRMMHGRWERIKCSFGTKGAMALPTFPLPVPSLSEGFSVPHLNIERSKMILEM